MLSVLQTTTMSDGEIIGVVGQRASQGGLGAIANPSGNLDSRHLEHGWNKILTDHYGAWCSTRRARLGIVIQWALGRPQARRAVAQVAPRAMVEWDTAPRFRYIPGCKRSHLSNWQTPSIRLAIRVSQGQENDVGCSAWSNTRRARRKKT